MRLPRLSPRAYRTVTVLALVALVTIVVTGAAVRLTGSGLGCTDWPQCEDQQFFAELDSPHAMAEFANRLFTGVVSLAVMAAVLGSLRRQPRRRDLTWLSLGLVAGVLVQIVWGGFTVWSELAPQMVMGHYLISAALVANAVVLVVRAGSGGRPDDPSAWPAGRPDPAGWTPPARLQWAGRVLVGVAAVVLVTGAVVTNTGPHAGDENARRFGFAIADVVRLHGLAVWTLLVTAVVALWWAYAADPPDRVRRRGAWLVAAIVAQGALGYTQYALGVPAGLVGVHVLGSVLVWIAVLAFHLGLVERPPLEGTVDVHEPEPDHAADAVRAPGAADAEATAASGDPLTTTAGA